MIRSYHEILFGNKKGGALGVRMGTGKTSGESQMICAERENPRSQGYVLRFFLCDILIVSRL